jgi:hypothetical protein
MDKCWYILLPFGAFAAIGFIIGPFGTVCCHLVYIFRYGMFGPKNLATLLKMPLSHFEGFVAGKLPLRKFFH